ncbi:MAG TPA: cell wall-binding repeat-containing protein [Actinocrinis sp.]|nr:cell wall-binding repeat-containing protein [Actinocrinis sp.]
MRSHAKFRRLLILGLAGTMASATLTATASASTGATAGSQTATNGHLAFVRNGNLILANQDGTGAQVLETGVSADTPSWTSNGSYLVYEKNGNLWRIRPDGTGQIKLTTGGHGDSQPNAGGDQVAFIRGGQVAFTDADGSTAADPIIWQNIATDCWTNDTDLSHFQGWPGEGAEALLQVGDTIGVYETDCAAFTPNPVVATDANDPSWSSDGSEISYVQADSAGIDQVFTVPFSSDGGLGTVTQLTRETSNVSAPRWSPDGTDIGYTVNGTIQIVSATTGALVTTIANAADGAWQPLTDNTVNRIYGADTTGTSIAASHYLFYNNDDYPARFVVLGSSTQPGDSLVGSVLAYDGQAPLLLTTPTSLAPSVLTEINRTLGGSGTVYLLGNTSNLSAQVESAVSAAGYTPVRINGTNEYDTAVKADQAIFSNINIGEPSPAKVLLAAGTNYFDALIAASAAGSTLAGSTAVVLTNGTTIPPASKAYLNTLDPTAVQYITIGTQATQALQNTNLTWGTVTPTASLTGTNEQETAVNVAKYFYHFGGTEFSTEARLVTNSSWQDALASSSLPGPLLLTDPTNGISPKTLAYLQLEAGNFTSIDVIGSPTDLPLTYDTQAGNAISAPNMFVVNTIN